MYVIGCAGQLQNGKDTVADQLAEKLNEDKVSNLAHGRWERAAFASNVKRVYKETFDVDDHFVEKWKVISDPPSGFEMNVRQSLQFIGDGFRKIQSTIWLDLAFRDKSYPIILSDVRYVNEFRRVKAEGGLNILVIRPDKINDDPNGSEAQIKPYVQWVLGYFGTNKKFINLNEFNWNFSANYPDFIDQFDVAIINDGTKEEVQKVVNEQLVPFTQKFKFN